MTGSRKSFLSALLFRVPELVRAWLCDVPLDMRAGPACSTRPNQILEVTLQAAKVPGPMGRRRMTYSTLYDAMATMDMITLIRSAIRGLLQVMVRWSPGCGHGCPVTMPINRP